MSLNFLKYFISFIALLLISIHIIWPQVAIDGITLGLIVIAIIPWLSPLFKSLQFPGGVKIEYQDLEKTKRQIKEAGLLPKKPKIAKNLDFVPSVNDDPTIALAWLRIEVEKRLRQLIKEKRLSEEGGLKRNLYILYKKDILSDEERQALSDLVEILSTAIHGVPVDQAASDWAIEIGPMVLKALDNKLRKK
jgi:hypothetical protein